MSKSKIFLYLLLAFVLGVAIASYLSISMFFLEFVCLLGIGTVIYGMFKKNKTAIIGGFILISLGAGLFRYRYENIVQPDFSHLYGKTVLASGWLDEKPLVKNGNLQMKFIINRVDNQEVDKPFYALVTTRRYPEYKLGDELKINGKLEKPSVSEDFDYAAYLAKDDIYLVSYFPKIEKTGKGKAGYLTILLSDIKSSFEQKIEEILPEPHGAFLKGLLFGEKQDLPSSLVQDFKTTGTTHIIALSGYNITIVSRFFLAGLSFLTVPFFISFWIAVAGIILFTLMTGASASIVRASLMGILVLISRREGRLYHMTNALILAGFLMIFQNPRILRFDVSFQLSFLATMGLVYLSPQLESKMEEIGFKIKKKMHPQDEIFRKKYVKEKHSPEKSFDFKKTLVETVSAQLAVLPVLLLSFGQVSLISPLSNILVLAAVPYSMGLGFLAACVSFVSGGLGQILGYAVWVLLEYKIRVIEILAKAPLASVQIDGWYAGILSVIYVAILLKLLWKMRKGLSY